VQRYVVSWRGAEAVGDEYVCGPTEALVYLIADVDALVAAVERAGGCLAIHDRLGIAGKDDREALAMCRAATAK
jgi:hypothetical protein